MMRCLRPTLRTLGADALELHTSMSKASELAESVSRKVRLLDVAKVVCVCVCVCVCWRGGGGKLEMEEEVVCGKF